MVMSLFPMMRRQYSCVYDVLFSVFEYPSICSFLLEHELELELVSVGVVVAVVILDEKSLKTFNTNLFTSSS